MKYIKLTRGKVAIVDDEDYEHIMNSGYRWIAIHNHGLWYAMGIRGKKDKHVLLHRIILDAPDEIAIDHKDCDGLNNQRSNLRFANKSQNMMNKRIAHNNKTGYKGVVKVLGYERYRAAIRSYGKYIHIGYFDTPQEAAKAYNKTALRLFGEFARINVGI